MVRAERNALSMPSRGKVVVLASVIALSVLALGSEVVIYKHKAASHSAHTTARTDAPAVSQSIPQMLLDINSRLQPGTCEFMNTGRAALLRTKLATEAESMTPESYVKTGITYGKELSNAGNTDEALKTFAKIVDHEKTDMPSLWKQSGSDLLTYQAVAYLRQGEQQNCCATNNANSCLIPITGSGIHTKQEGSRGAITCLLQALQLNPGNNSARWLLNLAYMTIGEYPAKVPARWLIPLATYGGEYPMKKFTNEAPRMALDLLGHAGSVAMEDFEGNGLLDLMISSFNVDGPLRYFHNNGDGTFTERTKEAGLTGELGGLNFIITDYNNDGRPDIVLLRGGWMGANGHYPLSLLRNDGNGHFTDVTIQAGLLTLGPTQTAVAFDYNGDGLLDLFVGYESTPTDPHQCKLFRNNGDGTFADVTKSCGLDIQRFVKGTVSADYMHSGRPGLYISCFDGSNILLRNDGPAGPDKSPTAPWKFTDVAHQAGVDLQHGSFSCFFFDYDNDGWPDLYVGGYGGAHGVGDVAKDYLGLPTPAVKAKLYHNNRDGTFTDTSKQAHLDKVIFGMGINFGDLDNDGWLDFYVGTGTPDLGMLIPKRMFRNHDGKYFDEVTTTGDFGHLQKGHGIAFGDLNNNGQQDVFLVAGGSYEGDTVHDCLFVNPGTTNHWVTLSLTGVKSNRIALGAEIEVAVSTPHGDRNIFRTVSTGGSFGSNPLRQEIGLGDATAIKQVTIHWPASGVNQTITNLDMDRFYKIREGDSNAMPWKVPTFKLKLEAP